MRILLSTILFACCTVTATAEPARLALIIDDLGYELAAGVRTVKLPGPVACAILPATPRARNLAEAAHANGKEVLLHLPLQAETNQGPLEPGGIVLDMSRAQFASTFADNVAAVPHAIGINSHRGSLLTRHPGHMGWLMEEITQRGDLFFVDSYTTPASIALQLAREAGVPALRRDVFLDPDREQETLQREFTRLKALARDRGFATGIGHPYPATLEFLERELPKLAAEGIELISLSAMVELQIERAGVAR